MARIGIGEALLARLTSAKRVMPTQNAPCCQLRGLTRFLRVTRDARCAGVHARELPVGDARGDLRALPCAGAAASAAGTRKCAERGDDGEAPMFFMSPPEKGTILGLKGNGDIPRFLALKW